MKRPATRSALAVVDLGLSSIKVRSGERGLRLGVVRAADGRIDTASRTQLVEGLREFFGLGAESPERPVLCGIPARGVALRRLDLPAVAGDEMRRLVELQLETELPLPVDELAVGFRAYGKSRGHAPSTNGVRSEDQRVVVAALRSDVLDEYRGVLSEAGLAPKFTLGLLAAGHLVETTSGRAAVLDIGKSHSELLDLDDGCPVALRTIAWGGDALTHAVSRRLAVDLDRAETMKRSLENSAADGISTRVADAITPAVEKLGAELDDAWRLTPSGDGPASFPTRLILVGGASRMSGLPEQLAAYFGGRLQVERACPSPAIGASAVTSGLETISTNGAGLRFEQRAPTVATVQGPKSTRVLPWAVLILLLLGAAAFLRFAPAFIDGPKVEERIAQLTATADALPQNDRELSFLEAVDARQAPYLSGLLAVARAAPSGAMLGNISMNQEGVVSLTATVKGNDKVQEFRRQLHLSGWFRDIVVQETPKKKLIEVQLLARLHPRHQPPVAAEAAQEKKDGDDKKDGKTDDKNAQDKPEKKGGDASEKNASSAEGKKDGGTPPDAKETPPASPPTAPAEAPSAETHTPKPKAGAQPPEAANAQPPPSDSTKNDAVRTPPEEGVPVQPSALTVEES